MPVDGGKKEVVHTAATEPSGDAGVVARPDTPAAVLRAAADLIEPEGAWTQGVFARDATGKQTSALSAEATCWCTWGAVAHVCGRTRYSWSPEFRALLKVLRLPIDDPGRVALWNDATGRTQAEVVAALRKAADLAEAEAR